MDPKKVDYKVRFRHSRETQVVSLQALRNSIINFLDNFCEPPVVDKEFMRLVGNGTGKEKFKHLLEQTNYAGDPQGFFKELLPQLEAVHHKADHYIKVNNVKLPYQLLLQLMELLIPENRIMDIRTVGQLQKAANLEIKTVEREKFQKVLQLYPVRFSSHTVREMRLSAAIAYQYMPFIDELNRDGLVHTWVGQFHRGVIEQMYKNRVIFILNMKCPVYCRFCFRKHKECRNQKQPLKQHVKQAIAYIKNNHDIKEIVLTGGDPFMNRATLNEAIDELKKVPHVETLRIATRSISYFPDLFFRNDFYWLYFLKRKCMDLLQRDKKIEIATHFIHPHEVSIKALNIISELVSNGVPVYVQTPFLKNCNDTGEELRELYSQLRGVGAEMHYIFMPCSPLKGNRRYLATIADGLQTANYLRAHLSDRACPHICTATSIGKIDWNSSGWAVEQDQENEKYFWIRTPYTYEYFQDFAPILHLSKNTRINEEGTIEVKFRARIGDDSIYWGKKIRHMTFESYNHKRRLTEQAVRDSLESLQEKAQAAQLPERSIIPTGIAGLYRMHKTRVVLDYELSDRDLTAAIEYIQNHHQISDVVISGEEDAIMNLNPVSKIIKQLDNIYHVNAIRIKSLAFNYHPQLYNLPLIKKLASLNRLSVTNPKRLEIETQFLHSSEFKAAHKSILKSLRQNGITLYNNTPVLPLINDTAEEMLAIADQCRRLGIEYNHLYLCGLPLQQEWSQDHPLDVLTIIYIATYLRRYGSGRELPRYIFHTVLGDVDFGIGGQLVRTAQKDQALLRLKPYSLEYFKTIDPDYQLPDEVMQDDQGQLSLSVKGIKVISPLFE